MDNKTKEALKQMQAEIRQLQATLTNLPATGPELLLLEEETGSSRAHRSDLAVQYQAQSGVSDGISELHKTNLFSYTEVQLARVSNEAAAALGYAVASPQKIALLRALLGKDTEGAAELSDLSGLSTGSLYHHLRELMRASLVRQDGRSRYALSDRGRRVLLLMLALAAD